MIDRLNKPTRLRAELSLPGVKAVGPSSPVQRGLDIIQGFLALEPTPDIATPASKSSGLLVGNHLFRLIEGCGLLNGTGLHSAAVTLLRPLEDALDCFAAVTLVKGAAERWSQRNLKPSDAAKLWTEIAGGGITPPTTTLADYRKTLRGQFAHYMHCSYDLCLWDLYFYPRSHDPETGHQSGTYELTQRGKVIDSNAHAIDAHLTAHILEFIDILKRAYSHELAQKPARLRDLSRQENEIGKLMEQHSEHNCQNVLVPPEWRRGNP